METIQKSDQADRIVYTIQRGDQRTTVTVLKTSDRSLQFSGAVMEDPGSQSWADFCRTLETGYTIENI